MAGRPTKKRRMTHPDDSNILGSSLESSKTPVRDDDGTEWKGFCEIESEPALFNVMLYNFGVRGVKVQEVVSLDTEMLAQLPRPALGLIFLFRWTDQDPDKQEQSCPDGIWFANQTSNNSCASVALLNIVNNVPGIDLGDILLKFKHFTQDFTPALRGDAINNFQFVKDVHNSYARKMDMLNADLLLKNEANARSKGKKTENEDDDFAAGYHFIAFMPINGSLWKFDGLERQPMSLGPVIGDWLEQATPDIQARMAQYEENQIEFAILSLVKDPIIDLLAALAENVQSIIATQSRLDVIGPDWRSLIADEYDKNDPCLTERALAGPDPGLLLTHEQILSAITDKALAARLLTCELTEALEIRKDLIATQRGLKMALQDEIQSKGLEDDKARRRTHDLGAKMQKFARKVKAMETCR